MITDNIVVDADSKEIYYTAWQSPSYTVAELYLHLKSMWPERQRLLIFGTNRCGKTAYMNMLNALPGVAIMDEGHIYSRWLDENGDLQNIDTLEEVLFSDTDYLVGDRYLFNRKDDKYGPEAFKAAGLEFKVLFIVRDPRDGIVVADPPNNTHVRTVLKSWYTSIRDWLNIRSDFDQLTVRYEDLIEKPRLVINRLAGFCGLPADNQLTAAFYESFDMNRSLPANADADPYCSTGVTNMLRKFGYGPR